MKFRFMLVFLSLFVCLTAVGEEIVGLVTRVADGDTLTLVDAAGKQHKIRFWGIDCPEKNQSMGRKAGSELSQMVMRKNVRVVVVDRDMYRREVGKVYLDGRYINLEMIRKGLAWYYAQYAPDARDLEAAEKEARSKGIGIWSEANPMAPWEFRKAQRRRK